MKLKSNNNQYQSTVTGKKIKMGFAADAANHLAELMSNSVYQDKYGSIVREVVSNAVDANVESGSTRKVEVSIVEKPALSNGVGYLDVKDYGPGISPERIENIFTQYFASTKRDTNEQIGGFGIGAKSPFAYTPVFSVITRVDGVKRTYLMEKTTGDRTCTLVDEVEVPGLISGTTIRIPIQNNQDESKFVKAIGEQLILLSDRLVINLPGKYDFHMPTVIDFGDIFCIKMGDGGFMEHDGVMLSLGDILYKIPHKDGRRYCPVNYVLKFNIGELSPTLSREGIEMNDDADVLIHNRAHNVTNLIENQWVPAQCEPTTNLKKIVSGRDKQGPNFPGTDIPIKHYNDTLEMARKFTVRAKVEGWPHDMDLWRFNQIVQSILTVSHKYSYGRNKFTTPNAVALIRDVIKQEGYEKYTVITKKQGDTLSGVWKEWFKETVPIKDNSVVIISVSTNVRHHIKTVYTRDLQDREDTEVLLDQMEKIVVTSLNEWLKKQVKYRDLQPTDQWIENRKAKRKNQKTNKWTKEALKESCPVRVVERGISRRMTLTYEQIKKPGNVVIANEQYKEMSIPIDVQQPVKFIVVSAGNYKRCVAAGAHCWSIDDINKINTRRKRQKLEEDKIFTINKFMLTHLKANTRTIFDCGDSVHSRIKSKNNNSVILMDQYLYTNVGNSPEEMFNSGSVLYNGRIYSVEKLKKIEQNFQKIMQRSACTKLIMSILGDRPYENHDNLYKELLKSLTLNTNG